MDRFLDIGFILDSGYTAVWIGYLCSSALLCVVFWRMTRFIRWWGVRRFLRLAVAVLLFTPIWLPSDEDWLAPAFMALGYELYAGNQETVELSLKLIAAGLIGAMLLVKLEFILRKFFGKNEAVEPSLESARTDDPPLAENNARLN
ncbi:MAG: hypothetical protein MI864_25990 [Pseudomonadales bacterium]|uniref:Uncharacterized protein n=1 Tax=Oleiphilus messinensis TaxID=141451 RepID=A0A1Y0IC85_9GAMM|nr:hypothetical protein [Oleiphilus messinensis]ARU57386.1 hypothetical protein OLMES_3346 [Oleiphilus messinensis]MCG8613978.1 hypothetical protein [Pseudomonadales bacterium]